MEQEELRRPAVAGVETRDGAVVVRLAGELDLYNAPEVREALRDAAAAGPPRLVVDLTEVSFIDSTALGALIDARRRLANRDAFLLASPGRAVQRALEVSGLDRHLSVRATVDDALAADV
jgi:anti-sigma B factor antagonist